MKAKTVVLAIIVALASIVAVSPAGAADSPQVIVGTPKADNLEGTQYSDLIIGKAGADTIHAGRAADTVRGMKGNDTITVYVQGDKVADAVRCGAGFDYVTANKNDFVGSKCEMVVRL